MVALGLMGGEGIDGSEGEENKSRTKREEGG